MDWFASYKEIAKWVVFGGRQPACILLLALCHFSFTSSQVRRLCGFHFRNKKSSLESFDSKELLAFPAKNGGDKRDRTADLLNAILG